MDARPPEDAVVAGVTGGRQPQFEAVSPEVGKLAMPGMKLSGLRALFGVAL